MVLIFCMTMMKRVTNFWLYSLPTVKPAISERHLRVTFRKTGGSRNCTSVYPINILRQYTAPEITHPVNQIVDNPRLKDITQRNPVQESQERLERRLDQTRLLRLFQHLVTQVEDFLEFGAHRLLERLGLGLSHLLLREIEDFFRKETEDDHVVFA